MKAFKFFAMMIAMLAISINFSSCDDGEEPITEIKDYYIGKYFNLGTVFDNMQKCIGVEF